MVRRVVERKSCLFVFDFFEFRSGLLAGVCCSDASLLLIIVAIILLFTIVSIGFACRCETSGIVVRITVARRLA
jgi:hypothetical protein